MSKKLLSASIMILLVAAPVADAAARCLTARERAAVHVRVMQTELMVAALSCRRIQHHDFPGQYNAFVRKHHDVLVSNSRLIQRYFAARYGSESGRRLDAFLTALANDASTRSMTTTTFCDDSLAVFQDALKVAPRDLEQWSSYRVTMRQIGLDACEAALQPQDRAGAR